MDVSLSFSKVTVCILVLCLKDFFFFFKALHSYEYLRVRTVAFADVFIQLFDFIRRPLAVLREPGGRIQPSADLRSGVCVTCKSALFTCASNFCFSVCDELQWGDTSHLWRVRR